MLKPKEKEPTIVVQAPVQISIAARPIENSNSDLKSASLSQKTTILSGSSGSSILQKESKDVTPSVSEQTLAKTTVTMKRSVPIISDYYQINSQGFDYLIESNTAFFVVGVIGPQGVGKSTILNILGSSNLQTQSAEEAFLDHDNAIFKTRGSKQHIFSSMPATEGIQMFITRDRTILLDCSPLLCNPYKKDLILNEIDDLKMVMFMLSVCHTVIAVEESGAINLPLLRLIQCAEKMKLDYDRDPSDLYSPNVIFVKNKCNNRDFLGANRDRVNILYKEMFKESKLKIGTDIYFDGGISDTKSLKRRRINMVHLPFVDQNSECPLQFVTISQFFNYS